MQRLVSKCNLTAPLPVHLSTNGFAARNSYWDRHVDAGDALADDAGGFHCYRALHRVLTYSLLLRIAFVSRIPFIFRRYAEMRRSMTCKREGTEPTYCFHLTIALNSASSNDDLRTGAYERTKRQTME